MLLKRLLSIAPLAQAERAAIKGLPFRQAVFDGQTEILRAGDRATRCIVVLTGLLVTSKVSGKGRQTTAFHIPGDAPDLQTLHLETLDSDVRTVTRSEVAYIEHSVLKAIARDHPSISAALWKVTLVDSAVFREWVVNIGQRPAVSRLAHIFCEIMTRMRAVGLADGATCALPITQIDLGEAAGISVVHVNRSLRELRRRGLLTFLGGVFTIHDEAGLMELADFRADYLHLNS